MRKSGARGLWEKGYGLWSLYVTSTKVTREKFSVFEKYEVHCCLSIENGQERSTYERPTDVDRNQII